jgi:hypothetical protein
VVVGENTFPPRRLEPAYPISGHRKWKCGNSHNHNLNTLTDSVDGHPLVDQVHVLFVQCFWAENSAHGCTVILSSNDFRRHSNAYNGFSVAVQDVPIISVKAFTSFTFRTTSGRPLIKKAFDLFKIFLAMQGCGVSPRTCLLILKHARLKTENSENIKPRKKGDCHSTSVSLLTQSQ